MEIVNIPISVEVVKINIPNIPEIKNTSTKISATIHMQILV